MCDLGMPSIHDSLKTTIVTTSSLWPFVDVTKVGAILAHNEKAAKGVGVIYGDAVFFFPATLIITKKGD